jgi:hypothetical protein
MLDTALLWHSESDTGTGTASAWCTAHGTWRTADQLLLGWPPATECRCGKLASMIDQLMPSVMCFWFFTAGNHRIGLGVDQ